jgi:hypothetical protein
VLGQIGIDNSDFNLLLLTNRQHFSNSGGVDLAQTINTPPDLFWRLALTAEIPFKTFSLLAEHSLEAGTTELSLLIAEALLQGVKRGVAVLMGLSR